jgi:branched-chain amino acid transport system substrate-binding protein
MANPTRSIAAILTVSLLAVAVAACSGGATSPQGAAPSKTPAPAASSAPAAPVTPTAQPAAVAPSSTSLPGPTGGNEIKIGGIFNITGQNASQAELWMKAANLAVKQINDAGGIDGKQLTLVKEDAQSTNPGALAAYQKMIEVDKPVAILMTNLSTQIQAVSDVAKAAGLPEATGGTAVKNTHMGNPWILRLRPDDSIAAAAMVQYIKNDMKLNKVGIINDSDAFGHGGGDLVEQYSKEQGLTVVRREEFTAGTKDFTAQLLAIKSAGAQVLVAYPTRPDDAAVIERQYAELGRPYQFMGDPGCAEADTLSLAKDSATGITAVIDYMPGITDVDKKYLAAYAAAYNGEKADTQAAYNYDAIYLFANAIKKVGTDPAKIRDAILSIHGDWAGACGTFDFTPNGDGLHSNAVITVGPGGEYKYIRTVTVPAKTQ